MASDVKLFFDEAMLRHDAGAGHPERPARLQSIVDVLRAQPVQGASFASPRPASRRAIERIHSGQYIDFIDSLRGQIEQLDVDTAVSSDSVEAAYLAAGAAVDAVTTVLSSGHRAFALVRPPGHHAECGHAMGFCLFNNIAIAAAHAVAELGCRRVLIVDWDVHHGNGTQHAFQDRNNVLVFNTHQRRLFPNTGDLQETGTGAGVGFTVNCPLPPGMNDATYRMIFERLLIPISDEYKPDLVLVSSGFDAHCDDPLGGMMLTEEGFANLCLIVQEIAHRHADGRVAMILEGGYNLIALARSVRACVEVLAGNAPASVNPDQKADERIVNILCDYHRRHWPV